MEIHDELLLSNVYECFSLGTAYSIISIEIRQSYLWFDCCAIQTITWDLGVAKAQFILIIFGVH